MLIQLPAVLSLSGRDLQGRAFDVQVAKDQSTGAARQSQPQAKRAAGTTPVTASHEKKPQRVATSAAAAAAKSVRMAQRAVQVSPAPTSASSSPSVPPTSTTKKIRPTINRTMPSELSSTHTLLYVNNLSFETTSSELALFFAESTGSGHLAADDVSRPHAELVLSQFGQFRGRSRGFAFVRVTRAQVDQALALNGRDLAGRTIGVALAQQKGKNGDEIAAESEAATGQ